MSLISRRPTSQRRTCAGASFCGANLTRAKLNSVDLRDGALMVVDGKGPAIQTVDTTAAAENRARLHGANLTGARMGEAAIAQADLTGAILRDTDLRKANLSRSNLSHVDLTRANLAGANLSDTVLRRAVLDGAIVEHADLSNAVLAGASLEGVDLALANMTGAKLLYKVDDLPQPIRDVLAAHAPNRSPPTASAGSAPTSGMRT